MQVLRDRRGLRTPFSVLANEPTGERRKAEEEKHGHAHHLRPLVPRSRGANSARETLNERIISRPREIWLLQASGGELNQRQMPPRSASSVVISKAA